MYGNLLLRNAALQQCNMHTHLVRHNFRSLPRARMKHFHRFYIHKIPKIHQKKCYNHFHFLKMHAEGHVKYMQIVCSSINERILVTSLGSQFVYVRKTRGILCVRFKRSRSDHTISRSHLFVWQRPINVLFQHCFRNSIIQNIFPIKEIAAAAAAAVAIVSLRAAPSASQNLKAWYYSISPKFKYYKIKENSRKMNSHTKYIKQNMSTNATDPYRIWRYININTIIALIK